MSLMGHQDDVIQVKITQNMNYLVSASRDKTVRMWNLDDQNQIRLFNLNAEPSTFQLTFNNDFLFIGFLSGRIQTWDIKQLVKIQDF
jgi:WD40 repeat protein